MFHYSFSKDPLQKKTCNLFRPYIQQCMELVHLSNSEAFLLPTYARTQSVIVQTGLIFHVVWGYIVPQQGKGYLLYY